MEVRRCGDATEFLERAEPWLIQREAENNLILGIARQLRDPNHPYQDPIYLATVEDNGRVAGCGYRTPPYKFGITDMPTSAVPLLVEDAADVYSTIPAILGPEVQATKFAELWALRFGGLWNVGTRQRIHQLECVINAPYAKPHDTLPIRDVRDPLYRGFCRPDYEFMGPLARFNEQKEAILRMVRTQEGLDPGVRDRLLSDYEIFYATVNDRDGMQDEIMEKCREDSR